MKKSLLLFACLALAGCQGSTPQVADQKSSTPEAQASQIDASGLKITDLRPGSGPEARAGQTVRVDYTGWLQSGKKFDSSLDRHQPFQFTLGAGQVIKGWDLGVAGMKVGGKRQLVIPPQLGYGQAGAGGVIPPNSTLVFEVELLGIN